MDQESFTTMNHYLYSSNDSSTPSEPNEPLNRLHISVPQAPPRLPAPPTFASNSWNALSSNQKQVHFRDARVVSFIRPGSSMSVEERNELWYPTSDLDSFKVQARNLSRKLREPPVAASVEKCPELDLETHLVPTKEGATSPPPPPLLLPLCPSSEALVTSEEEEDNHHGETRGLEHRVCINRQRHKHLAIRCTLKAQNRSRCPDFIARISSQCSQWARDLAVQEANRDYCEAYYPQYLTPKVLINDSPFPVPMRQTKRCHYGAQQNMEQLCPEQMLQPNQLLLAVRSPSSTVSTCPSQNGERLQQEPSCKERSVRQKMNDAKMEL